MRTDRRAGFTLIELMIVVVVIGILASIAIPKYRDLTRTAHEAEVEPMLREVFTLEQRYAAREGNYTTTITDLEGGASLPNSANYYTLGIVAHASGFCAVASPNPSGSAIGLGPRSLDATRNFHHSTDCS